VTSHLKISRKLPIMASYPESIEMENKSFNFEVSSSYHSSMFNDLTDADIIMMGIGRRIIGSVIRILKFILSKRINLIHYKYSNFPKISRPMKQSQWDEAIQIGAQSPLLSLPGITTKAELVRISQISTKTRSWMLSSSGSVLPSSQKQNRGTGVMGPSPE